MHPRSLFLSNLNNENLMEILVFDEDKYCLGMSMFGHFAFCQKNLSHPICAAMMGPTRWPKEGFLTFLAGIAANQNPEQNAMAYRLYGTGDDNRYYAIALTRTMPADHLARLVGVEVDDIREWLKNLLIFVEAVEERNANTEL